MSLKRSSIQYRCPICISALYSICRLKLSENHLNSYEFSINVYKLTFNVSVTLFKYHNLYSWDIPYKGQAIIFLDGAFNPIEMTMFRTFSVYSYTDKCISVFVEARRLIYLRKLPRGKKCDFYSFVI